MNEKVRAFLMVPPALALLGALAVAPQIVHLRDERRSLATVAQISAGTLETRNVEIDAMIFANRGLRQVITEEKKSPKVSFFMPIGDVAGDTGPSLVVVHTFQNEVFDAMDRPGEPLHLEGTVRDVLWEGLDGDVQKDLKAIHPLAPNVKLLELRGMSNADDKLFGYGVPVLGFALGLFVAANVKPKPPQTEAAG